MFISFDKLYGTVIKLKKKGLNGDKFIEMMQNMTRIQMKKCDTPNNYAYILRFEDRKK